MHDNATSTGSPGMLRRVMGAATAVLLLGAAAYGLAFSRPLRLARRVPPAHR